MHGMQACGRGENNCMPRERALRVVCRGRGSADVEPVHEPSAGLRRWQKAWRKAPCAAKEWLSHGARTMDPMQPIERCCVLCMKHDLHCAHLFWPGNWTGACVVAGWEWGLCVATKQTAAAGRVMA